MGGNAQQPNPPAASPRVRCPPAARQCFAPLTLAHCPCAPPARCSHPTSLSRTRGFESPPTTHASMARITHGVPPTPPTPRGPCRNTAPLRRSKTSHNGDVASAGLSQTSSEEGSEKEVQKPETGARLKAARKESCATSPRALRKVARVRRLWCEDLPPTTRYLLPVPWQHTKPSAWNLIRACSAPPSPPCAVCVCLGGAKKGKAPTHQPHSAAEVNAFLPAARPVLRRAV